MKILVTGANGNVGKILRPVLAEMYEHVLLSDLSVVENLTSNESCLVGNIEDPTFTDQILSDVDGLVHLAGLVGPDYTYDQVMGPNVHGTKNLLESAVKNGVKNIVYASSHHVVGFYKRGDQVGTNCAFKADSFYGVSKAFGEILTSYYADQHKLSTLCIRIGNADKSIQDERRLQIWTSARDLAQLIDLGLRSNQIGCRTVYGVSKHLTCFLIILKPISLGIHQRMIVKTSLAMKNSSSKCHASKTLQTNSSADIFANTFETKSGINNENQEH